MTAMSITPQPIQILLIEDSPGDAHLTREAMQASRVANELHVVTSGDDALAFMAAEGAFAEAPRPDLILLDLNLPGIDGREVLARLKREPAWANIPVVVLTTSSDETDILRSYELHANSYITKPIDFDEFIRAVRAFEGFWLSIVRLPAR